MRKFKVESLKVNIINALQLDKLIRDNTINRNQIYIQSPEEFVADHNDIVNLKETKQDKLRPGSTITINSDNVIEANIDLSPYYTKTQTAKLFMGRDETYTKEIIDEKTSNIVAGDNILVTWENNKRKISSTIQYRQNNKSMSIGTNILGSGTSVGAGSQAVGENSVALGAGSLAVLPNQVSIGNETIKRVISNVANGIETSDAVTVGQLTSKVSEILAKLNKVQEQIYPIGSIYMNVNNVNPAVLFGGTWEKLPAGRMLVNEGDGFSLGSVGGEKTHRLSDSEVPSHTHNVNTSISVLGDHYHAFSTLYDNNGFFPSANPNRNPETGFRFKSESRLAGWNGSGHDNDVGSSPIGTNTEWHAVTSLDKTYGNNRNININVNTSSVGGGQAHNNMPPYLTVNMWKRTR